MDNVNQRFEKGISDTRVLETSIAMMNLQNSVIGVFRPRALNDFEMVIEKTEHTVRTIRIGSFFGLQDNHYGIDCGDFFALPKGYKNLFELLQKPHLFHDWFKSL